MAPLEAFFLPLSEAERFCVLREPVGGVRGAVLFVHAFGEEMNNSRHMAAAQARRLAAAGWVVLQMDLFGCGDSCGEFADATWDRWLQDISEAQAWLRARTGHAALLWGMRAGALLCSQVAARADSPTDLLLWQPVVSGKQHLHQLLRLHAAHTLVAEGRARRSGIDLLRQQLLLGSPIEVGGYALAPALALPLEAAELRPGAAGRIGWLEVAPRGTDLSPASRACISQLRADGHTVDARTVAGPRFWQVPESGDLPALIDLTSSVISAWP